MKPVLVAMALMAVVPPSAAPYVLAFVALALLLRALAHADYPTFETVTQDPRMAAASDPRLAGI